MTIPTYEGSGAVFWPRLENLWELILCRNRLSWLLYLFEVCNL